MMHNGSELILIVIGLAILLVIFVILVKFFRQIMLALAATAILGIGAFALISQAGATRETAKAAKTAATAATVASAGQTANTMILAMLSGVLIVVTLVAVGGAGYLWIRARRAENRAEANRGVRRNAGDWRSGPNALWGRDGQSPNPQSYLGGDTYPMSLVLQQLMSMQAMMMQAWMRPQAGPQVGPQYPSVPPRRQERQPAQLGWEWNEWDGQSDDGSGEEENGPPVPLDWGW